MSDEHTAPFSNATQAPPADAPNPGVADILSEPPSKAPSSGSIKPPSSQSRVPISSRSQAVPMPAPGRQSQSMPLNVTQLRRDPFSASKAPRVQSSLRFSTGSTVSKASAAPQNVTQLRRDPFSQSLAPRLATLNELPSIQSRRPIPSQMNMTQLQRDIITSSRAPLQRTSISQSTFHHRTSSAMPPIHELKLSSSLSINPPPTASKLFPPATSSVLHTPHDHFMASRQTKINELDSVSRKEQDAWAREKISEMPDVCPQKFAYQRRGNGYVCGGGSHFMTDELIAEGMGGMYAIKGANDWENRSDGPYYLAKKDEDGTMWFQNLGKGKAEEGK
ncbi:hypothetical protein CJF31_00007197 [Rutstroemia sp. NJR-2017a BVV2]|nr:hypothetical protein CJF31_00007197 [Rutstroemia sp. NJR-2017a BVV2]